MPVTSIAPRETPASPSRRANAPRPSPSSNDRAHAPAASPAPATTHSTGHPIPARPSRHATDDEILGLERAPAAHVAQVFRPEAVAGSDDKTLTSKKVSYIDDIPGDGADVTKATTADTESLRATLDANPDLRRAWDDAQSYRESFASPDDARNATALLADLDRMDALFFSRRPEDHAELARAVAGLDPAAFASLAQAMQGLATSPSAASPTGEVVGAGLKPAPTTDNSSQAPTTPTAAQSEFFHATNAAAVESVLDAIESQVERLLPEGVSKSARNRVVGEIYRELDTTLRSNRQLAQQMRDGFRSGSLDAEHQRALVSLVTGRARQALPGVAKRVLGEWTSTIVAANHDRRARQQAAERRVDIAGSGGTGSDGSRSMAPRDIDYRRMSDADILNL
jgi:hypothetical protein